MGAIVNDAPWLVKAGRGFAYPRPGDVFRPMGRRLTRERRPVRAFVLLREAATRRRIPRMFFVIRFQSPDCLEKASPPPGGIQGKGGSLAKGFAEVFP